MNYKVVGIYRHERRVDSENLCYKNWRECWRGRGYKTEEEAVVNYVRDLLDYQIVDDDGHGTLSALSLNWTIEKED